MIRVEADRAVEFCDGLRRRDFLRVGHLGFLGLGLPGFLRAQAAAKTRKPSKDVNCIMLFLVGGPSQHDTWDPKPEAPAEIRGPYQSIPTAVPGTHFTEIFPLMARQAKQFSLIRSVNHASVSIHETGHQFMQTGRLFQGGIEHPHIGCVVSKLKGAKSALPPHILLPRLIGNTGVALPHGQTGGYLGKVYDPFTIDADPSDPNFRISDLRAPDYLTSAREDRRRTLRKVVDDAVKHLEDAEDVRLFDSNIHHAYTLVSSREARAAFELGGEPAPLRERYGKHRFGQSCLLARRLVEAGVRFVTVNMFDTVFNEVTWDSHGSKPFSPIQGYRDVLAPQFDQAFTALLADLSGRGMLDNTLVVALGEFGRTPKINPAGGRDHWPSVFTVLMAGGGVQGGRVIGSSDEIGAQPKDRPVSPADLAATIYTALGISPETDLKGPQDRPIRIVDHDARPVTELFA
jgi:hypothetical protein